MQVRAFGHEICVHPCPICGKNMRVKIPQNIGKVKVAMALGGKYAVWNGRQGQHEFYILVRNRKQAEEIVKLINGKQHGGEIEVTG